MEFYQSFGTNLSIPLMEFVSFMLLFVFLLLFFIFFNTHKQNSKFPPGPWKLPLIGSLHHLVKGLPHHTLRNLSQKHGPLMHLQLGELSTIVVSSPKMAKEVMKTHDLMFVNRPAVFALDVITYGGKNLVFAPYGDYWKQIRKICTSEVLSTKRVQSFQPIREAEVTSLVKSISSLDGSPFNLTNKIFVLTNDIIARAAFGKKCQEKEEFIHSIDEMVGIAGGFNIADTFPSLEFLRTISGMKAKMERIHRKVDRVLEGIIKEHKENWKTKRPNKDDYDEDIVDALLRLLEDTDLEIPLTMENIKGVILDVFVAGSETSSTLFEWAMSELIKNPRVMEKAQAEVRRVLNGKREIQETDISELHYLKSVLKETLRLHPPLPLLLPRECVEECKINGYEIPVKTKVILNAWAIGRDPQHWSNAEKFDPERFDGISIDYKGTDFEYIPFGGGRRICPGISLGMINVELPLAQLLYHFDWKLPDGLKPEELDMTEAFGSAVPRRNNLYVSAVPYSP